MDPVAALIIGVSLFGCMMLSYIRGWKDAVAQHRRAIDHASDLSRE
ncbi:MAG: hypothetical protein Q8Q12_11785 [bacterium]|nr:hypothetical protein [bacterium]